MGHQTMTEKYSLRPGVEPRVLVYRTSALPLSYLDRIQFCYLNSGFILITQVSYCVCTRRAGWYMYVGSYMSSPERHMAQ